MEPRPIRSPIGFKLNDFIGLDCTYRCDSFTKDHDPSKDHVLFAGCSFTAGEALEAHQTWAYKVYQRFKNASGFFNIGVPAFSVTDVIDSILKYINLYGNPTHIFALFPDAGRDGQYCAPGKEHTELMQWREYAWLELYCKSNNIKLYTFTWDIPFNRDRAPQMYPDQSVTRYYPQRTEERQDWSVQMNGDTIKALQSFDTFYYYTQDEMEYQVFLNDVKKNKNSATSLVATDDVHPGESFHDFFADFIADKAGL